jgi:hypothetical protein
MANEMQGSGTEGTSESASERLALLTLEQQRELVLRLAPRVLAQLPEMERRSFLRELNENLSLGQASTRVARGDSNPGALEVESRGP